MNTQSKEKWFVDLKNFTCRNKETNMVVSFEKKGSALVSKIMDLPLGLIVKWSFDQNANKQLRKAVIEADEAFYKAYFDNQIEEKGTGAYLAM